MQTTITPKGTSLEQNQPLISHRYLSPRAITSVSDFQFRHTATDKGHVRGLVQTLRATGQLDPILVWQEVDALGLATGRLVLLDGHHRLAAYATFKPREDVPATIFTCTRAAAMVAAVEANSRERLPLTKSERMDAAWRLVRLPGERLKVKTVAGASGVGTRSVDNMRKRWKTMLADRKEASGEWWRDRQDVLPEMKVRAEMSDEERLASVQKISARVREALGKMPWQDEEVAAEAIQLALGTTKLRSMAEWLFFADEFDMLEFGMDLHEPDLDEDIYEF
jgi:ParB-like chromosome segregation protein Spo0J